MGRVAVVTGSASGMGLSIAERLAGRRVTEWPCWTATVTLPKQLPTGSRRAAVKRWRLLST